MHVGMYLRRVSLVLFRRLPLDHRVMTCVSREARGHVLFTHVFGVSGIQVSHLGPGSQAEELVPFPCPHGHGSLLRDVH